ncbi:hypothetical protein VNO77_18960 [Canavalia gladiata]|uniref:Uncharacterized protein n=1 Tax=Canavalia gladiata TaxID=3824 RepID=A0AAN9LQH0_CANGL
MRRVCELAPSVCNDQAPIGYDCPQKCNLMPWRRSLKTLRIRDAGLPLHLKEEAAKRCVEVNNGGFTVEPLSFPILGREDVVMSVITPERVKPPEIRPLQEYNPVCKSSLRLKKAGVLGTRIYPGPIQDQI